MVSLIPRYYQGIGRVLSSCLVWLAALVVLHWHSSPVWAASNISFNFSDSGNSPQNYGQNQSSSEWRYIYGFGVESDDAVFSSIEYQIDGGARIGMGAWSTSGSFDDVYENIYFPFDQRPYADGSAHTITFYAITADDQEASQSFDLSPTGDPAPPVFTADEYTEGDISEMLAPFSLTVEDEYLETVTITIDGIPYTPTPSVQTSTLWSFNFNLAYDSPPVDVFDGESHTLTISASDPYGNTDSRSFTFRYRPLVSEINFTFNQSGNNPNAYGTDLEYGEWRYIYVFTVDSSVEPFTAIEYALDGGSRVSLLSSSETGVFDDISESIRFLFDQRTVADGLPHTLTFYARTADDVEASREFTLQPTPDTSAPPISVTERTEGLVSSTSMPFHFSISDQYIEDVIIEIDGLAYLVSPYSFLYNSRAYQFDLALDTPPIDELDGLEHTLTVTASDPYGNQSSQSFTFRYQSDTTAPSFTFTASASGLSPATIRYTGSVSDTQSDITNFYFEVDGEYRGLIFTPGQTINFDEQLTGLSEGSHTIVFYAEDEAGNVESASFTIDMDVSAPSCTAGFTNLPSPHYSKILNYQNVTCTDNRGIVSAAFEVYHVVYGTFTTYAENPVAAKDGIFGGTTESFDYTVDLSAIADVDGNNLINFQVKDAAGNTSYDYDPVTIDANDNTAPTVNIDAVTPDPLTDTTPTLTGSCRDETPRETNTNISLVEYRIDAGAYQTVTLPAGQSYNTSRQVRFSFDLPTLALGAHTVTIRCIDGATNSATASDSFTIVNPSDPEPGEFAFTENFDDFSKQDIPNSSNVIWGNGQLRLKEDITISRHLISSANACPRYATCFGPWRPWKDPQDSHIIWYEMSGQIYRYNTQTQTNTLFNYSADYSLPPFASNLVGFAVGMYNGKKYVWMSDAYRLYVINLTDGVGIVDNSYTNVNSINLDFARGRFGAYVTLDPSGGSSNVAYINLNDMMNSGDNTLTRLPFARFSSDNVVGLFTDPSSNAVFVGPYSQNNLFKFNDNNTPENTADDITTVYTDPRYQAVFAGMTLDPQGRLIFGSALNSRGHIFVVENDGNTPFDASDDNVVLLASPQQLGYRDVVGLEYIAGQNNVGDQLLITTSSGVPVYLNFNSTYTNPHDDTFIELDTLAGVRPSDSVAIMDGYNTMYVVNKIQGFYRVTLNRGWVDSGEAVALPTRPPQQLVVDNFVAEANTGSPIAYLDGQGGSPSFLAQLMDTVVPQAYAAHGGVHYFVSTDGGDSWTEVTLGQLQQLQQSDYRLKFKIELGEVGGATPVLTSYSLAYAGYPDPVTPTTTTGLKVTPSTATTTTSGSFGLTVEAVDVLGFRTSSYNGGVTVSLIDTATNTPTSGLSLGNLTLSNGVANASGVQINKTGTFRVRVSDGNFTQDSGNISVSSGAGLPSPFLGFSASSFKIKKGETVRLDWASNYLTSFVINPGNNQLTATTGQFFVSPSETTTYTITGTGPYGSTASSLTITVEGELGSGVTASPSPSPTASVSPRPRATPGTGGTTSGFTITTSGDQTIVRGQKAEISWSIPDAERVFVDYPERREVSSQGSFEFFPNDRTVVTITAEKDGESVTRQVTVNVIAAPIQVQELARDLQQRLPWTAPLISGTVQATKAVPGIGLGAAAAVQSGVVGLLVLTVASQAGFVATLNIRTFTNILAAAGLLPAKQRKGFIHQTRVGAPIPFATVSVFEGNQSTGRTFATLVSDMYGAYFEPYLPKGTYTFLAAHATHQFPTKQQRPAHLTTRDFYRGEVLSVASSKERSAILIPMDPVSSERSKRQLKYRFLLFLNQTLSALQWTIYPLAVVSAVAVWLDPNWLNILIAVFYAAFMLIKLLKRLRRPSLRGRVVTENDRKPVTNATLTLTTEAGNVVAVSKSDAQGYFSFFAPHGHYGLQLVSDSLVWRDLKAGTLYTVQAGPHQPPLKLTMARLSNPFGGDPF